MLELVSQRIYGLMGYEDLVDHDDLRHDPLLAVLVGKSDPTGQQRARQWDQGKALAGKSTLNRLELTPVGADAESRYKKIVASCGQIERLKGPTKSKTVSYLDSANWNPDNLLYGTNGLAARTFCDVPIGESETY